METMGKLIKMKIFISGIRGVGLETAKNIVLSGPNRVTICDDNIVRINDLGTNFWAKENDVGQVTRADCVIN